MRYGNIVSCYEVNLFGNLKTTIHKILPDLELLDASG